MGRFDGKVAFITGGARGQGRSHALTLAKEGADIVLFDVPGPTPTISYPLASAEELKQTEADVTALGRRCIAVEGDVRSFETVSDAVQSAIDELGHVDIMLANAGVATYDRAMVLGQDAWHEVIDINLHGVWNAIRTVLPHMVERRYGRIVATSSTMGRMGGATCANYAASKWAVIGLVKSVALDAAEFGVTANAVCPGTVNTPLIQNQEGYDLFCPDIENPTWEDAAPRFAALNPMRVPQMECQDVTNVVAFLASDDARYVTGAAYDVSAGKSANWNA